jgi:pimeloyl-ACP methyl ester carboxylesterase
MIRRAAVGAVAAVGSVLTLRAIARRAGERLVTAPRTPSDEVALGRELDALGGEVVHVRSRDGLRLAARWLPAEGPTAPGGDWRPDPHEAILLLHGWFGSSAPHLVEHGPFLRRTAGVLGLDFRGHGGSDASPSTLGLREVEDVAGALAWLGERGIDRVALVGMSMGGATAIAAVAILGDGTLRGADADPAAPAHVAPPRRPWIVAVVGDSVAPELVVPVASRLPGPASRLIAARWLRAVVGTLGGDPRETEPARVIGLLEGVPLMLISGEADTTVPAEDARRLAAAAPAGTIHWMVPDAEHGRAHAVDPDGYETGVTNHLRNALTSTRGESPIIAAPDPPAGEAHDQAISVED